MIDDAMHLTVQCDPKGLISGSFIAMVSAGIEGSPSVKPLTLQVPIRIDPQCYELPADYAGVIYKIGDGIGSARFKFGHIAMTCGMTSATFIFFACTTYCIILNKKRFREKPKNRIVKTTPQAEQRKEERHEEQLEEMGGAVSITQVDNTVHTETPMNDKYL